MITIFYVCYIMWQGKIKINSENEVNWSILVTLGKKIKWDSTSSVNENR